MDISSSPAIGSPPATASLARPAPRLIAVFALLAALMLVPIATGADTYVVHLLMSVFIFATLGHAWNLMAGFGGMLSFGQQVFIGLAGFSEAILIYYAAAPIAAVWIFAGLVPLAFAVLLVVPMGFKRPVTRSWALGAALCLAVGYEIAVTLRPELDLFGDAFTRRASLLLFLFLGALPLLRLRGAHFAIATWLIAESVATIFNGWPLVGAGGGMQINAGVDALTLYYLALSLAAAVTLGIFLSMRSTYGLALMAVRDDEEAAESSGIDVMRIKTAIFLISAFVTGLAAGLYFMDAMIITPASGFSISWASYVVFVAVAGGMGTVSGPLIGAVLFVIVDRILGQMSGQGQLVLGLISIALMLFLPQGLAGLLERRGGHRPALTRSLQQPSTSGEAQ